MADVSSLFRVARASIEHGLEHQTRLLPSPTDFPQQWRDKRASFVTLTAGDGLRGCIGTTEAIDPLVVSVARNAYLAAFEDPRFQPLTATDYAGVRISLSLLSEPEPLMYDTESELIEQLQAGRDGLIIEYNRRRATYLPSVWESMPDPVAFVQTLKQKGGLPPDQPPQQAWRYYTEYYEENA